MCCATGKTGEKMELQAADDYFGYTEKGSSFDAEIRAGFTTFLTMAYILLVNPAMLTLAIGDGTDAGNAQAFSDILFATAIAAFVGCTVMGLWANLPFALAPGMGLNAYFTFTVVNFGMGIAWELALFAVFVEGILFLIMSMPQILEKTKNINAIKLDIPWSDLGSWNEISKIYKKNKSKYFKKSILTTL